MISKRVRYPLLGAALLIVHNIALAVPITNYVHATSRVCIQTCIPGSNDITLNIDTDYGETGLAQVFLAPGGPGTETGASAGYGGNGFAPTLSAYAYSTDSQLNHSTTAFGLQRYEFTASGTVTINGALTYSQSGATLPPTNSDPLGQILGSLFTFQMVNDTFDLNDCIVTNMFIVFGKTPRHCSIFGSSPLSQVGVTMPTQFNFQRTLFNTGADAAFQAEQERSLSFTGNAGDIFFLGSELAADARLGGFSNSRNTLKINFDNPDLIQASYARDTFVPAPLSVPEPSAIFLFCIAAAGVFLGRARVFR